MNIETIYKIWCPKCNKIMYVNDGDTTDLTVEGVEGVECPHCSHRFALGDEYENEDNEPYYTKAVKTLP